MNNREIGRACESNAVSYLEKNGYMIIDKNYRMGRYGEIDVIAKDGEYLCFIEIKARATNYFGTPAEAVRFDKQLTIKNVALKYLKENHLEDSPIRFDVVEINFDKTKKVNKINITGIHLIRNAF